MDSEDFVSESAIVAKDLIYRYRTESVETTAVNGVSFQIHAGDYTTIRGASGSGKSSLLSLLGLVEHPAQGDLSLFGADVIQASEAARSRIRAKQIGMVFQSFHLIPDLSVIENLLLKLSYSDGKAKREHVDRAHQVLERLGISERKNHFPDQLSGGQQQRAAIARALVSDPQLLLADEPTGNLDSSNSEAVMEIFDSIHAEGVTIVMVTHDETYARKGTRQLVMKDGVLLPEGGADVYR